ncbi:hypothetical protein [Limnoraphis robusta]|uniref:hypothetical protein n=1 Tax=Limnoraphis robusta TaxID=1118279 RepID=UPI00069FE00F|nr:hypothetical protein [Limnoraphis robusta]
MTTPQEAKLQNLIATATNPKQKAMYEALLKKVKTQSSSPAPETPSPSPLPKPVKPSKPKPQISTPEVEAKQPQASEKVEANQPQASEVEAVEQQSLEQVEFQGIGILKAEVHLTEDRSIIKLGDQEYRLFYIPGRRQKAYNALKKEIETTGNLVQRLIVYPKLFHFPRKEQPHGIGFQLVGFVSDKNTKSGVEEELKDGEFRLCGLWQFIPVCRVPCISIFRNFNDERLAWIKEADPTRKVKFMKASHIPLLWKDAPVRPFRFNPKLEKEEQGKPHFVQVKAKFLPDRDLFGFVEELAPPIEKSPRFLKASKKDKAIAKLAQTESQS